MICSQRAKDHVDVRDAQLRDRERQLCARESVSERLATRLEGKEHRLKEETTLCEIKIKVRLYTIFGLS